MDNFTTDKYINLEFDLSRESMNKVNRDFSKMFKHIKKEGNDFAKDLSNSMASAINSMVKEPNKDIKDLKAKLISMQKELLDDIKSGNTYALEYNDILHKTSLLLIENDALMHDAAANELVTQYKDEMNTILAAMKKKDALGRTALEVAQIDQDLINEKRDAIEDLLSKYTSIYGTVKSIIEKPYLAWIYLTESVLDGLLDVGKTLRDTQKTLGVNLKTMADFTIQSRLTTSAFLDWKEALEISTELSSLTRMLDIEKQMTDNASNLVIAYNLTGTESAKIATTMRNVALGSNETATHILAFSKYLGDATDVAPGQMMRDIANSSEDVAMFTDGTGKNIAVAAASAGKLGVELGTVLGITKGLMDIDSTIKKTMEASVLLGKNINFNKATELMASGDIAGAMKNMIGQFGSVENFNQNNIWAQQSAADAMGVNLQQMKLMLANKEKLATLDKEQLAAFNEYVAKGDDYVTALDKAAKASERLKNLDWKGILAGAMAINNITGGGIQRSAGKIPGKWGALGKGVKGLFGGGQTMSGQMVDTTASSMNKMGGTFDQLGKNWKGIAAGGLAVAAMAGGIWIISDAFKKLDNLNNIGQSAVVMGGSMIGLMVAFKILGQMATAAWKPILIAAGAMAIISGSIWLLGAALNQFVKPMEAIKMLSENIITLSATMIALPLLAIGFTSLGMSLMPLAMGLMMIAPFLPVLAALSNFSNASAISVGGISFGNKEKKNKKENDPVLKKLEEIASLLKKGATVELDGAPVGKWFNNHIDTIKYR